MSHESKSMTLITSTNKLMSVPDLSASLVLLPVAAVLIVSMEWLDTLFSLQSKFTILHSGHN